MKKLKSTDEILNNFFWTGEWDGTGDEIANLLTQDRDQAYTSLIEGIKGMKITTMAGLRFDEDEKGYNDALNDIIEKVVKPLYGKGTCYTLDENKPDTCPSNCSVHGKE